MKFLGWTDDKWLSKNGSIIQYDKLEHLLLAAFGSILGIFIFNFPILPVILVLEILGILWEIKDGVVPYDKEKGLIEGFSWKDFIADNAGILLGLIVGFAFQNFQ
ncbi:MAG: hypothetical protein AMJ53_00070 [Gammaproteobacteria bacterium SG8_11]|nr:MAG: hypothetical protein AMJ53_00070 [Gammaproteobacteria bacterium SG8_11]